ncbi:hypothetical protein CSV61_12070 [Sporosarcina sp. P3]|uniref:hypothetical protein n=1 Tax=Sporosarcina sp. P3 TaxID=2048245 RepID=UPI000C163D10|nr:hypothetical protein [Sporosarcina sp. P3]PID20956.1 hypothetical protein CSV61_12070 [Sporosarcina sp. P3]
MKIMIEEVLLERGIHVTQTELGIITVKWQDFKKIKNGFEKYNLKESDIALTHHVGSVNYE